MACFHCNEHDILRRNNVGDLHRTFTLNNRRRNWLMLYIILVIILVVARSCVVVCCGRPLIDDIHKFTFKRSSRRRSLSSFGSLNSIHFYNLMRVQETILFKAQPPCQHYDVYKSDNHAKHIVDIEDAGQTQAHDLNVVVDHNIVCTPNANEDEFAHVGDNNEKRLVPGGPNPLHN